VADEPVPGHTLEDALLFLADRCDFAQSIDGQGFNKNYARFGNSMAAKVRAGQRLTPQEYKDAYKMLKNYNNNQLIPAGMDIRLISKDPPQLQAKPKENTKTKPTPEAVAAAREVLLHTNPIQAHVDYAIKVRKVHGGEKGARMITMSAYSAFLLTDDRLHTDVVGSPQNGKSKVVTAVLETFPEENVLMLSEASPKSLYYLAETNPEALRDLVIYLDDQREEHIPVLKTFRNEGNVTPCNLTVGDDKESLLQQVPYRPVIIGSSVNPLRDLEQQAGSRAFLVSIPDATPEEEKQVRKAIRAARRAGAISAKKNDQQRDVLRAMAWILRVEGVRDVLIPFDAEEPDGADRRGTGQFMKLIKISAFINQFQRPVLELTDGRKFVLAIYDDLEIAATIWFDFAEGQQFKISPKAMDLLKMLPNAPLGKTSSALAREMGKSQRTIERYLEDLFEAGLVCRQQITASGVPWGYWCEEQMRQRVLSRISDAGDLFGDGDMMPTEVLCRKYMAEKSSDSLKDSIEEFFSNNDIIDKEMYRGIIIGGVLRAGNPEEIYLNLFSPKSVSQFHNGSIDSD
jgi:DNA-binding transcriptional ArsR family regulator